MIPGMPDTEPGRDATALDGLRVLHVVEKYRSGVGSAIAQYTRSLPEVEHHLLSGTPVDGEGDLAEQADFTSAHRMTGSTLTKVRRIRSVVADLRPHVVHAHSSHGGVYARLALLRRSTYLVYTPHCYAFERRDISAPVRAAFWAAEALLAVNTSAFAACSAREYDLSGWPTRRAPRHLVPNIAPAAVVGGAQPSRERLLVIGGGRLSPQKDPAFFLAVVRRLRTKHPELRALWLGDGEAADRAALEAGGVEVSGWLPRAAGLTILSTADLYLHSARWEGFPLMVAEAAALGVPTLVRRLPSFADVPPALTVADERDVQPALDCLEGVPAAAANVDAWAHALRHHTLAGQRAALTAVYRRARPHQ